MGRRVEYCIQLDTVVQQEDLLVYETVQRTSTILVVEENGLPSCPHDEPVKAVFYQ